MSISSAWRPTRGPRAGDTLTVAFNGERVIATRDTTFPQAGKVGLWTKADSMTHFADLEIDTSTADVAGGRHV
jgi:hypothetical protein